MEKSKRKKLVSNIITGVLGALIVGLIACQVTMFITARNNHNVSSLFGYSFLSVATNSMEGKNEEYRYIKSTDGRELEVKKIGPWTIPTNYGVIIKKISFADVKVGMSLTFYNEDARILSQQYQVEMPITHRVIEKIEGEENYLICYGDNDEAQTCLTSGCSYPAQANKVLPNEIMGEVVVASKFMGDAINLTRQTWFLPVMVLVPLAIVGFISAFDMIKKAHREQKEEDEEIERQMIAAGVDPNDESKAMLFREKARYKLELKQELEREKEAEKKRLEKELKKKGVEIKDEE
ncbi:MAG: hypothetical protein K5694_05025 [Bacilli bacterium]|nr:hypothetical protein [Bacilli bacterium]